MKANVIVETKDEGDFVKWWTYLEGQDEPLASGVAANSTQAEIVVVRTLAERFEEVEIVQVIEG